MGKKKQTPNIYDFNDGWEDVQPDLWEWVMWNDPSDLIGWIVEVREEPFIDKNSGEERRNLVCYLATPEKRYVRFIVPTDLRYKLDALNHWLKRDNLEYRNVALRIVYKGMEKTTRGYNIKRFELKRKKLEIPKDVEDNIPPLPPLSDDDDDNEVINEINF